MSSAPPGYDVYLSYREADREVVDELAAVLENADLSVWRDVDVAPGSVFEAAANPALEAARFVGICVGESGLGQGQLRELTLVEARSAQEPDVRFAAVLLPGLPADFSG